MWIITIIICFGITGNSFSGDRGITVLYKPQNVDTEQFVSKVTERKILRKASFREQTHIYAKLLESDDCSPAVILSFGWYAGYDKWQEDLDTAYALVRDSIDVKNDKQISKITDSEIKTLSEEYDFYSYCNNKQLIPPVDISHRDDLPEKSTEQHNNFESLFNANCGGGRGEFNLIYFNNTNISPSEMNCCYFYVRIHDGEYKGTLIWIWRIPKDKNITLNIKQDRLVFPKYMGIHNKEDHIYALVLQSSLEKRKKIYQILKGYYVAD
ncbi:MAG: hypothetical protein B6244_12370 [Candidatus Cloacimonetes bacterium 4572_55]|nr:MAG: hypothetical protein B6244_12370 [Candidatus Cloacimonetes bacterium 4572_55]